MTVDPRQTVLQFVELFNARDLNGMLGLIDDNVVTVFEPGAEAIPGKMAWKQGMRFFLEIGLPLQLDIRFVHQSGDTALVISDWMIEGDAPGGNAIRMQGTGADVLRRDSSGKWLYLIDNPFGTALHS
ncbi:nuclear transport factor 2 family protein [Streptomyces sp. NPDC004787]|uniref:YybH family protein n=1 Tax=Streptomyces sp. NPDC004787 TaxID=3154291 RepID=UPI0033A1BA70